VHRAEEPARKAATEARVAGLTHIQLECPRTHAQLDWSSLLPALAQQLAQQQQAAARVQLRVFGGVSLGAGSVPLPLYLTATGQSAAAVTAAERRLLQLLSAPAERVPSLVTPARATAAAGASGTAAVPAAPYRMGPFSSMSPPTQHMPASVAAAAAAISSGAAGTPEGRALESYLIELDLQKYLPIFLAENCFLQQLETLTDAELDGMGVPKGPR
jgi:hypothetical protein